MDDPECEGKNFSGPYSFLLDLTGITYIEPRKFSPLKISKDSPFLSLIFLPDNKKMSGHLLQKEMNKIFNHFMIDIQQFMIQYRPKSPQSIIFFG